MESIKYNSQVGQDELVDKIFRGMKYGYFVEVGAADGIQISDTYALEKYREWDGLCIEAHTTNFEKLKANRKCAVDNSVVGRDGEEVKFTEFLDGDNGLFSSITPNEWWNEHVDKYARVVRTCSTVSLYTLFKKHHVPTVIHYMSVDVNGTDYEVLKDYFDKEYDLAKTSFFTRYILTLSIEHNFKEPIRTNIRTLLESHNFVFYKEMLQDDFYVHRTMDLFI